MVRSLTPAEEVGNERVSAEPSFDDRQALLHGANPTATLALCIVPPTMSSATAAGTRANSYDAQARHLVVARASGSGPRGNPYGDDQLARSEVVLLVRRVTWLAEKVSNGRTSVH